MINLSSINYFHLIIILIMCHLFGDYVLQSSFKITYLEDQVIHYVTLFIYFL